MLKKFCTTLCFVALSAIALLSSSYAKASPVQILISTDQGNIQLELYPDKAPKTVKNFLTYVNDKY